MSGLRALLAGAPGTSRLEESLARHAAALGRAKRIGGTLDERARGE